MNILLTEADYKDKYPPLGLMKIATFHKLNGDNVVYTRDYSIKDSDFYSKIYIGTRFSFHWKKTKALIEYYQRNFKAEIIVGGIHASINPDIYRKTFNINPIVGSYKGEIEKIIDKIKDSVIFRDFINDLEEFGIDFLPPEYSIFEGQDLPFNEILSSTYLIRATKGCTRNCTFCDVKKICNSYIDKYPIKPIVNYISENFGEKKDILFFDDNTLLSSKFSLIIDELKKLGFVKNAKFNRSLRSCDFNQGLDLRLLTEDKLQLISTLCIRPIRFAFDDVKDVKLFENKILKVIELGIRNISVYVLYNYSDSPYDFYRRLTASIEINKKYNSRITSFPMKYVPNDQTDRLYIGKHWTKRKLRSVQCILNGCHGIVPVMYEYFYNAFGKDFEQFESILQMPEKYIINRKVNYENIAAWQKDYSALNSYTREQVLKLISDKTIYELPSIKHIDYAGQKFLKHYLNEKY